MYYFLVGTNTDGIQSPTTLLPSPENTETSKSAMGDSGFHRFHGHLDPRAQEFRPRNPPPPLHHLPPPPQLYYLYNTPPFCGGGLVYHYHHQFPTPPALYNISPTCGGAPPLPPPSPAATRTLVLSSVVGDVSETAVRRELEVYGEVRGVQMERVRDGIVTVHFYDLRHAEKALREIRQQHMQHEKRRNLRKNLGGGGACSDTAARGLVSGKAVWAQFVIPASNAVPEGNNQGTLVVFNLDPDMSANSLKKIFEVFGTVKEVRETPLKKHQRFIEFFDVRHAAMALRKTNGKEIHGKQVVIQFSRPGGHSRKFLNSISTNIYRPPPPPPPPHRAKKLNCVWENPNGNLIEDSMGSLCLDGADGINGYSKKHAKNGTQQQQPRISTRKVSKVNKLDTRFLIKESAIVEPNCRDSRTTVMIKNIPNKYSQKLLLNMLDNHCIRCNEHTSAADMPLSSYDFVYLPIDFNNKCNVGYGFVNMTSPQATLRLYKAFHQQHWEVFNSRKICEVTYARVQGLEALKEHFKNSKFPSEMEQCLPVVFSPPRDGRRLTEPLPVVNGPIITAQKAGDHHHDHGDDNEMDGQDCIENGNDNIVSDVDRQRINGRNGGDNGDDDDRNIERQSSEWL